MPPLLRGSAPALLSLLLAACASQAPERSIGPVSPPPVTIEDDGSARWRAVATAADQGRLARLGPAWSTALTDLRRGGRAEARAEGELLDPNAALPRPAPPPGPYRCRLVRLGGGALTAFKPFFCYVEAEDDLLTIVKQTGSQRPAGRIYPDSEPTRLVFLGTLAIGDETEPLPYGENASRDLAGVVERVAPFRWRLVIPWPQTGGTLEVIELVPAT